MARAEGSCQGLPEPCAEVYGAHAGDLWVGIGVVAAFAALVAVALVLGELNKREGDGM
jgi:hypothetical protein